MDFGFNEMVSGLYDIEFSDNYRMVGNDFFKQEKYLVALSQYNHALALCRNDKVRTALCYANRAAVYLKLNYFEHCLNNIKLAELHYPAEKIHKLNERREQCLAMMDLPDKAIKPFVHSYKLSYEANPKIPFFIDAIKMNQDKKNIITTKDLKAGDVIAVLQKPWKTPVNDLIAQNLQACYNCIKANDGDLIPGECCAMFCSDKCRNEHKTKDIDHEPIHQLEKLLPKRTPTVMMVFRVFLMYYDLFGSTEEMRKFVEAHANKKHNFFDFDWSIDPDSPEYHKNVLLLIVSKIEINDQPSGLLRETVVKQVGQPGANRFSDIFLHDSPKNLQFIDNLLVKIMSGFDCILCVAGMPTNEPLGIVFHPFMSLSGKSCDPNMFMHFDSDFNIVWTVNQPIKAGSELISHPRVAAYYRQQNKSCQRDMNCRPCINKWSKQIKYEKINIDAESSMMKFFGEHDPTELSSLLKYIRECSDFINSNFGDYDKNSKMRQKIATKKEEMRRTLNSITSQLPAYGLAMLVECAPASEERYRRMNHYEV